MRNEERKVRVALEGLLDSLRRIEERLASLEARIHTPLPFAVRYQYAASLMDMSVSKLKGLIRDGTIRTVKIGGRKMVPTRELDRVATPKARNGRGPFTYSESSSRFRAADRSALLRPLKER